MEEDSEVQLQIKKRARRRLVGAVFFVSLVALVLPMLMDHDPRPPMQDVEIRIPGQDDKPFAPAMVAVPVESAPLPEPEVEVPVAPPPPVAAPSAKVVEVTSAASAGASAQPKPAEKPVEKVPVKASEKPAPEKKPEVKADPAKVANDEARRAAAILAGQSPATATPAASAGEHLILIGAFANEANVVNLRKKLGELGIKTFTEPLDSPQGRKTRVRAGPFPNRDAAEKALEKMKRIGVTGVVAPKS